MEALRLSATHPHQAPPPSLLPCHPFRKMRSNTLHPNPRRRPFIAATVSKSVEISPSPSSSSCCPAAVGDPLPPPPLLRVSSESLQYPPGYLGAVPHRSRSDGGSDDISTAMNYLTNILSSKVYDIAIESPLELAPKISERLGVNIWLKREDLQPIFSFKIRGAYNLMAKLPREVLEKGVICSSAGNHAQGVAIAAKKLNCSAVVAMPVTTPEIKWKSVERLGATIVLIGDSYEEAQAYAKKRGKEEGRTFVPGFDHPDIIMGVGTVGMEIVRQMESPLHAIFVPVGGGGLISGIAAYVKRVSPQVKIIGVEPTDANSMALSLHHDQRVILDPIGGFADGVAIKEVGEECFRICKELIDGVVLVDRDSICASIKDMFEENRSILEPAGALALAGAEAYCKHYGLKGENVVAITSGANMNFDKLRTVTEFTNLGGKEESLVATVMPNEPEIFKQYCELMGDRSDTPNEVLCCFTLPEIPGALMDFVDAFGLRWNISSFNYRGVGESRGEILVGIQIPRSEMDEFHVRANRLGYEYKVVNSVDDF